MQTYTTMKSLFYLFLFLFLYSCKQEQTAPHTRADASGKHAVSLDGNKIVCYNTYHKYVEIGKDKKSILIRITEINETFKGKDSSENYTTVEAFDINDMSMSKALWSKEFRADEVFCDPRYLRLFRNPRGENEDLSTFVDYFTGTELISFTGPNAFFAIPEQEEKRVVGFLARANDLNLLQDENQHAVGILTYASAKEQKQTISFIAKDPSLLSSIQKFTPGMMIKTTGEEDKVLDDGRTVILGSLRNEFSPEKLTGIYIQLIFYLSKEQKETTVTIPIIHDKMDISAATYDRSIFTLKD